MRLSSGSRPTASWEIALPTHQRTTKYAALRVASDGGPVAFDIAIVRSTDVDVPVDLEA